jgi:negative regulator of sigma E activity
MSKDILKLTIAICVLAAVFVGVYFVGKSVDNQSKYKHPITQQGAGW